MGDLNRSLMGAALSATPVNAVTTGVHLASSSLHQRGVTRNRPQVAIVAIDPICREIFAGRRRPCPAVAP
jgi:hypothetical protein